MPISKKRKKPFKKKQDYNKNKINKIIKTYIRLLDNYMPLMKDYEPLEITPYNTSKANGLGDLSLSSIHLTAVIKPIKNNEMIEKTHLEELMKDRLKLMLALHVMLDIMPDDIEENNFTENLRYYFNLIGLYYNLVKLPTIKIPDNATFYIKSEFV